MRGWTLNDIQTQIASEIDGNATINSSGADWGNRLGPINRALFDWSETYDWSQLHKVYDGLISTSTGNASVALRDDFRRSDGIPFVGGEKYIIENPNRNHLYVDTDRVANILGDDANGYTMVLRGPTLASWASVQFTYFASPMSLSSIGQRTECPDPTYLVQKSLYYIYKSRNSGKFPEAKAEADRILAR